MEVVGLQDAQGWCSEYESTLRASFGRELKLPEAWEAALAELPADTLVNAIKRYALLKHYTLLRLEQKKSPQASVDAARRLLRREPITVVLEAGRSVQVTSRSYAASAQISIHAATIRELQEQIESVGSAHLLERIHFEISLHRRAIWANALTKSGGPALSFDEAPEWWSEVTPVDDGRMLGAVFEAGPLRYAELGSIPPSRRTGGTELKEDFGWASLFAVIETEHHLAPAELYDRDLYQLLTWRRSNSPELQER